MPRKKEAAAEPTPTRQAWQHSHSVETEEVAPPVAVGYIRPAPAIPPERPFHLVVNTQRWDVMAGRVVPIVSTLEHKGGVGGVELDQFGRANIMTAQAQATSTGRIILPHDVDGPKTSYLRRIKANGGYTTKWEQQFVGSTERRVDDEGFSAWLVSLIDRKIIPGPTPYQLVALAERLEARIETYTKANATGYAKKIEATKKHLEVVRAELAKVEAELEETDVEESAPEMAV